MSIKLNLNILIVIFLIILFLLIMFKDKLRSTFTKYSKIKKQDFSNMWLLNQEVTNPKNITDISITYTLPQLTNLNASKNPASWYKWPIIYIFDPSGQALGNTATDTIYNLGGAFYNQFVNFYSSTSLYNAVFAAAVQGSITGASATVPGVFTSSNYPLNLYNTVSYYNSSNIINNSTVLPNFITGWTASNTSTPNQQVTPDSNGLLPAITNNYNMGITISGSTYGFYKPMVIDRTYIIGIANGSDTVRLNPSSFPLNGRITNFIYKKFTTSTEPSISITFTSTNNPILSI